MQYDTDVAVIGGGTAGLVSASVAAALGACATLIEADKVGGECLWRGCVPSKTLVKSARVYDLVKRSAEFGVHVEKPRLIWNAVKLRLADVRDEIKAAEREALAKSGVTSRIGTAKFLDDHTLAIEQRGETHRLTARSFIIATGSNPRLPDIEGLQEVGFVWADGLFDKPSLPKSLVFIGGGPVSCEMAQTFARFGTTVTVLQGGERILDKEEPEVSELMLKLFRAEGIAVHLNARATRVESEGERKKVTFQTPDGEQSVVAGEIVVAVGKVPAWGSLELENIGIRADEDGIQVDGQLKTSAPNVWACGDVTGNYYFTHVAENEGKIAGANAVLPGPLARKVEYRGLSWVTFTDPEIAHLGQTLEEAKREWGEARAWHLPFGELDRAIIEGETAGFARIITTGSGRIVGAHIAGPNAGEIIAALIVPVREGALLSEFADAMLPYPTLSEIVHRAGNEVYQETDPIQAGAEGAGIGGEVSLVRKEVCSAGFSPFGEWKNRQSSAISTHQTG